MFDFIHTYTGQKLHFLNPTIDEITIESIANNLSKNCRYCGNINEFYSVAEHSVILANKVYELTGCKKQALTALMHDATEAYLCDIPRPIKPHLIGYTEMEQRLADVIFSKFGVEPIGDLLHKLDTNIVADEAAVLFNEVPDWISIYEPIGVELLLLSHKEAQTLFMDTFLLFKGE